jgi:hypothetical protein
MAEPMRFLAVMSVIQSFNSASYKLNNTYVTFLDVFVDHKISWPIRTPGENDGDANTDHRRSPGTPAPLPAIFHELL